MTTIMNNMYAFPASIVPWQPKPAFSVQQRYPVIDVPMGEDWIALCPELYLASLSLVFLVYGVILAGSSMHGYPTVLTSLQGNTILGLTMTTLLCLTYDPIFCMEHHFTVDGMATFLKVGVCMTAALVCALGTAYWKAIKVPTFEIPILMVLACLGLMCMVSSQDLMTAYLALEFQSLALYVLASITRTSVHATEAGLKYFVLGALASGLLLMGCVLIYASTGLLRFDDLMMLSGAGQEGLLPAVHLGILFLVCGLVFKLAAAPFHMWSPDVYEGAPTAVTAFFGLVPKLGVLGLFARVVYGMVPSLWTTWQPVLLGVAVASFGVGAFGAIAQQKIKRLIAYSSIGHAGWMVLALGSGTHGSLEMVLTYVVLYVISSLVVFSILLGLRSRHDNMQMVYLSDLKGLGTTHPMVAASLSLALFSMAGIPPLGGFVAKAVVLMHALEGGLWVYALLGVLASVVSAFYYIRVVKTLYFEAAPMDRGSVGVYQSLGPVHSVVCGGSSLALLGIGVYPAPLLDLTHTVFLVV